MIDKYLITNRFLSISVLFRSSILLNRDLERVRSKIDEKLEEEKKQRKELLEAFTLRMRQKYPDDQVVKVKTISSILVVITLLILSLAIRKSKRVETISSTSWLWFVFANWFKYNVVTDIEKKTFLALVQIFLVFRANFSHFQRWGNNFQILKKEPVVSI